MTTPKVVEAYIQYKGKKYLAGSSLKAQKGDKLLFQIKIKNMDGDSGWGGVQIWDVKNTVQIAWNDIHLSPYAEVEHTIEVTADSDRELGIALYSCESAHTNCKQTDWYGIWNIRVVEEVIIPIEYLALGASVGLLVIGLIFMGIERQRIRQRMMEMISLAKK